MTTAATLSIQQADAFPIDLTAYQPIALDPSRNELTPEQREALKANIALCRDAIVFFTATGAGRGVGGHTGGPYDTVPEVVILDGLLRGPAGEKIYPAFWDEAGHRVATQYLWAVLAGELPAERLLHYREYDAKLPGHPELGLTPGIKFSSGRLGHIWPFCNGVAMAHPDQAVFVLGSDGSQQEGNDAEAARLAVANKLNIKLLIDDNDVTIAGHPSEYLPGYDIEKTLAGHGLSVDSGDGEDLDALYKRIVAALNTDGPVALVNKRVMAPGIPHVEGTPHGHDVVSVKDAITYLEARGHTAAIEHLKSVEKDTAKPVYPGCSKEVEANRSLFGKTMVEVLGAMDEAERKRTVRVFDCDLEGSTGIKAIGDAFPDVYVKAGIMERGNFSAAAGFGFDADKQGVYATFSAFLEMAVSEITMARLNKANVLAHYSHAGVDDMADNTCHFGINNLFCDGGLDADHDTTRVYFPGDPNQFRGCVKRVFQDPGLRFVFSNRSKIPYILNEGGEKFYSDGHAFEPGKDDIIREAKDGAGYVVSFGSTLHRALAAVQMLREDGLRVGLINKTTLNVNDPDTMAKLMDAPFVLLAEEFNVKTGVGVRLGADLMKRGYRGKFNHIGTHTEGSGGLWRQMDYQGLGPDGIADAIRELAE